jgi:hypothetical protein
MRIREQTMTHRVRVAMAVMTAAVLAALWFPQVAAQTRATVAIDADDIGGVVTSSKGPEAGVWVVAETTQLPTKFARVVVTDDQGRYVVPDLPKATYDVFVRGYGLVDSPRIKGTPGQALNLTAVIAPDARSAAQVYPAGWWLAMMKIPDGAQQQEKFQQTMRGCLDCHQVGNKVTRELSPAARKDAKTTLEAWQHRTKFGPSGSGMGTDFMHLGPVGQQSFVDWTDRIARGETPTVAPPRPAGVERNLVVTVWDWGTPLDGRADNVASDRRNPRVNANGPIYGVSQATDGLNVLDPVTSKVSIIKVPSNGPVIDVRNPSPTWGEAIWKRQADPRSVEIDGKGRVWLTLRTRDAAKQPSWCGGPGANAFGKYYPQKSGDRQVAIYDPKTKQWDNIDVCFHSDHNEFGHDNFAYYGSRGSIGWVDGDTWDKTHDAEKSQGWCPAIVDTNGDGKISEGWTEPNEPVDPKRDHRVTFGCYAIGVSPLDNSVWCSSNSSEDRQLVRIERGKNAPQSCKAEFYEPRPGQKPPMMGTGGVVVDHEGVAWQSWRVSGQFISFDRRKCKSLKDSKADGQACPEGWTIYRDNEPSYSNSPYHATEPYLNHMDTDNVLGLGKDSPMYGSINTDSMEVFSSAMKKFVPLRVAYPMGFFPRSATIRVDDPKAGWKGGGLWSSFATYASWHLEPGKGALPKVVKFQMRPNPLAK